MGRKSVMGFLILCVAFSRLQPGAASALPPTSRIALELVVPSWVRMDPLPFEVSRTVRDEAGLPAGIVLYSARHSFAIDMPDRTGNLALVQRVMGHESIMTTQRYPHPELKGVAEVVDQRNVEKADENLRHRATLAVARKLVVWMLAVERRNTDFMPAGEFKRTAAA